SDASVRCEAVDALGAIGNRVAIPALIRRLDDRRGFVRFRAAIALDDLGCDAGVPEFIRHINHIMFGDLARERLERISQRRLGFDRLKWDVWWALRQATIRDAQRFALFEDGRSVSAGE
ncbi:MAG: HEAT repeat domain-containing protein, partial [Planctomycetes bacterium]|nr:HEAT repeat domain-containing protein [Planctomycetota bacterium]